MEKDIIVSNTLSGKKELFKPLHQGKVLMYVCGVTPYDHAHIGHARVYVTFDVLNRLLQLLGYEVTYCRNFTDIDDKLLTKAKNIFGTPHEYLTLATQYIASFHEDMEQLNCLPPTYEPRVTDNIKEIISFIEQLITTHHAYVVNQDVYFDIHSFKEYAKLSKRDINDLLAGSRVDIREEKKNPLDFALWKSAGEDEVGWQSPWGKGRPGWHIECSVLAYKYLGKEIDIHAGGMDLIFPHHENEIAQSEAAFKLPFARYWLHNAFVKLDKEKMSKSLGNIITLKEILIQYNPALIRYYLLLHHYRAPLDFSYQEVEVANKSYKRLITLFKDHVHYAGIGYENQLVATDMLKFLRDDLNTPGMFGVLFEHFKTLQENIRERAGAFWILNAIGLSLEEEPEEVVEISAEMKKLLDEREIARAEKNWARADALRDQLRALGFELQDKKVNQDAE